MTAFLFMRTKLNTNKVIELKNITTILNTTDSFAVSNAICKHVRDGVVAIVGVSNASAFATIQSYSNTFHVPFITPSMAQNSSLPTPYQIFMRPMYIDALLEVIKHYGWPKLLFLYDTDEGLIRLQQLFQAVNAKEYQLDIDVKRATDAENCYAILTDIHEREKDNKIRVMLDLPAAKAEEVILKIKNNDDIGNHKFHFLLGDLGIDELNKSNFKNGGINISGFQLLNTTTVKNNNGVLKDWMTFAGKGAGKNEINFEAALVVDAVDLLDRVLRRRYQKDGSLSYSDTSRKVGVGGMKCTDDSYVSTSKHGSKMMEMLKEEQFEGVSGNVAFDKNGLRKNFKLSLKEMTMNNGLQTVGTWENKILKKEVAPSREASPGEMNNTDTRIRRVTTILAHPYVMYKDESIKTANITSGKENFEGYCIDLAQMIADELGFKYEIYLVKDGKYGEPLPDGTWNGMVGELTRREADMAIAPITITSKRERVVDFTKPYMSLGISIMIKKPSDQEKNVFSFMDPLSYEIWMCILFAYIGVSVVLFLVSRFSPTEWHVDDDSSITNDFTISNSLWYSLGAFMQQGCDISPRSISGRIVGSVWWFFTLIIISSYTANLAAFLTVERMLTPIESAEDLAKQTEIKYGTVSAGSTKAFFESSQVAVYERMWAYMTSAGADVFKSSVQEGIEQVRSTDKYAFLIESAMNEYVNMQQPCNTMKVGANLDSKGYGIATPRKSELRDRLTLTVLQLRESGKLANLKKKWWDLRTQCPPQDSGQNTGQTALNLNNVAGIFYILIGGLILAVVLVAIEFLYKSKIDSKRSQTSFGSVLRCKARLSFRGSLDGDTPSSGTPLRKSMSTYTYTGPTPMIGIDGYTAEGNTHTQV
ncbi:hypothetical protein ScPMuIL_010303 [Solemya velum]